MHDQMYSKELLISNRANGYRDVIAVIDLQTYRRIPWENDVPFFLVSFVDPDTKQPIFACPRSTIRRAMKKAEAKQWQCYAGVEYEVSEPIENQRMIIRSTPSSTSNSKVGRLPCTGCIRVSDVCRNTQLHCGQEICRLEALDVWKSVSFLHSITFEC